MLKAKLTFVRLFGCLLTASQVCYASHDHPGPWVIASTGEPWPMPAFRQVRDETYKIHPDNFIFQITNNNCDILEHAIKRYNDILILNSQIAKKLAHYENEKFDYDDKFVQTGDIHGIKIHLMSSCQRYPHLYMNESYDLIVSDVTDNNMVALASETIWGILRGLETFSQLIITTKAGLSMKKQRIRDYPKLSHRGLLLDTSRHYLPVKDILRTLDAMSYNKLNVLHWHIVDDNSFPYESKVYPELSEKGAYHPSMIYTRQDMKKIVEYARLCGIRVIAEFDTPGHTKSWGLSHPEYLTTCYDSNEEPNGNLGPMNPTDSDLYPFLSMLFTEVKHIFPDDFFHIGGDEVPYDCWRSNPEINNYMRINNISRNYHKLEELHYKKVVHEIEKMMKPIVWQEVYENVTPLKVGTVVQLWTGQWRELISRVTSDEYGVILSTCWYLDHISNNPDWTKFYECDPLDFQETFPEQKSFVLGGEACMWGEFVDRTNVHARIWPRASAAAERLWSIEKDDVTLAAERLEEHACRMNRRGIPAQPPNGAGFCVT